MSDQPIQFSSGIPTTVLPAPDPADADRLAAALDLDGDERRAAVAAVVAASPRFLAGWAELGDLAERMRNALDQIHPNQRRVLELAYYEGMSQSAIAEHLQIPLGTVKTRSRQGLLALRGHLLDFSASSLDALALSPFPANRHGRR